MINIRNVSSPTGVVRKESLLDGKNVVRYCIEVSGQTFSIQRGPLTIATLEDELFHDVRDPEAAVAVLRQCKPRVDIFTFAQRVPEVEPKYAYPMEWDALAVLPVSTYDDWWNKQVARACRNKVRKSQKAGVEVRVANFDDEFVRGMVDIFGESPIRQGRRFWHYGKDFETVKRDFSTFLFREDVIGAYLGTELIGFVMLANAGRFGVLGQFISKLRHRDKGTNNALIAKTVEVCADRGLQYLLYTDWRDTTLVDFKRYSGFEEMPLPRYWIPLTLRGRAACRLGLHHEWRALLPHRVRTILKRVRTIWCERRWQGMVR